MKLTNWKYKESTFKLSILELYMVDIRYQSPKYENGFLDDKKIINHDHVIVVIRYQSPKYENGCCDEIHFHISDFDT